MLLAVIVFSAATLLVLLLEQRLLAWSRGVTAAEWVTEHVYSPLLRILAVLAFVLSGYPEIYGLDAAPDLGVLLSAGQNRFDALVNWLLLISLLLPLAPMAERLAGLVLPLQGITACCVLFHWLGQVEGLDVRLWMGWRILAEVLAIGVAASWLARVLERRAGDRPRLAAELVLLLAQLPAIVLYSRALGGQL